MYLPNPAYHDRPAAHERCGPRGFTLIELLVVITILVVLLALLTPALDQAIYQTELAVCATRLRAHAGGVQTYAFDARRSYPYRAGVHAPEYGYWAFALKMSYNNEAHEHLSLIRDYMDVNGTLNHPLCPEIDIENAPESSWIWIAQNMWYGFKFGRKSKNPRANLPSDRGMLRVGDRLEWSNFGVEDTLRFDVLVTDKYHTRDLSDDNPVVRSSHPDSLRKAAPVASYNTNLGATNRAAYIDTDATLLQTLNHTIDPPVGLMDMNFAHEDGSVDRLTEITYENDERIDYVPVNNNGAGLPGQRMYLPRARERR